MKQKRDANGKFVKMYPSREEYEAKIAKLEEKVDKLALEGQEAKNEASFWRQEYNAKQYELKEQQQMLCTSELHRFWLIKHCGFILRWRYDKAVEKGEL
jgi:hypothetical protein